MSKIDSRKSKGPKRQRFDFPRDHPVTTLLDRASHVWRLELLDSIIRENLADLPAIRRQIWTLAGYPPPPQLFELIIDEVQQPFSWAPGQKVIAKFTLRNHSGQPTSGFVHGTMTQGIWRRILLGRWFQNSASVENLPSGQELHGAFELTSWVNFPPPAGQADVSLDYWVKDPQGTITFVQGLPGEQSDITYSAAASVDSAVQIPLRGFAVDIRPLFRKFDIEYMKDPGGGGGLDLSSYEAVVSNSQDIYNQVKTGRMPCGWDEHGQPDPTAKWSLERVAIFKQWMDEGMLP